MMDSQPLQIHATSRLSLVMSRSAVRVRSSALSLVALPPSCQAPDKCLIRVMHRGVAYATICSSKVGYDESLERTAMTASSAGEEDCSLVPEGPTKHGRPVRLNEIEGQ